MSVEFAVYKNKVCKLLQTVDELPRRINLKTINSKIN